MILGGMDIIKEREAGKIKIEPFDVRFVGPDSYDVHLHDEVLDLGCNSWLGSMPYNDPRKDPVFTRIRIPAEGIIIMPGELFLGCTVEDAGSDHYVPMYAGRSTIGRWGVWTEVSAAFGDVGFDRQWTLEIACVKSFLLLPGMKIGQVYFEQVSDTTMSYKHGHNYSRQSGPTPPKAGNI